MAAFRRYNSSIPGSEEAGSATESATKTNEPISTDASEQSSVRSAVAAASETGASGFGMEESRSSRFGEEPVDGMRPNSRPPLELEPSNSLYIGNILFEVTPQDLEREFAPFGEIVSAKIAQDARGLSKGYVIIFTRR